MKKYSNVKLFCSIAFCILTAIAVLCGIFIFCYIFEVRIPIDYDNTTCENINITLISLTTGYIVSYITYLFSAHIPNYNQEIKNEKLLREHYLWRYHNYLTECFGILVQLYDDKLSNLSNIEEIESFSSKENPKWFYYDYLIKEAFNTNGNSLITKFDELKNTSNIILSISQVYNCSLSMKIAHVINPEWFDVIKIIQCEISENITDFKIINAQFDLISENFALCRDG